MKAFIGPLGACLAMTALASCVHSAAASQEIILRRYHDSNYAKLNAALGTRVCVVGEVTVSASRPYFLLQPYEKDGFVTPSPSRVIMDLEWTPDADWRRREDRRARACGILRDATPWEKCERDHCRWYELQDPEFE